MSEDIPTIREAESMGILPRPVFISVPVSFTVKEYEALWSQACLTVTGTVQEVIRTKLGRPARPRQYNEHPRYVTEYEWAVQNERVDHGNDS